MRDPFDAKYHSRPDFLVSGGQHILIKLDSTVFPDTDGNVGTSGRYINSQMSSTSSGDPLYTRIVVTWNSEVYKSVQKVNLGSYWNIAQVVATFGLSVELLVAMYGRFYDKGEARRSVKSLGNVT